METGKATRRGIGSVAIEKGSLEHVVSELARHDAIITGLAQEFRGFRQDFAHRFDELARELASRGQVNWGWIVAGVSLLVAIASFFGSSIVAPMGVELKAAAAGRDQLRQEMREHESVRGHTWALEQHAAHAERFKVLGTEIANMDSRIADKIDPISVRVSDLSADVRYIKETRVDTRDLEDVRKRLEKLEGKP